MCEAPGTLPRRRRSEPLARCGGRTHASDCGVAGLWFAPERPRPRRCAETLPGDMAPRLRRWSPPLAARGARCGGGGRAAADAAAEIRAVREEVNDAVRAATNASGRRVTTERPPCSDAQRSSTYPTKAPGRARVPRGRRRREDQAARARRRVCPMGATLAGRGIHFLAGESPGARATKSRSLTLLPRLVHSLSMRFERRQLTKALCQIPKAMLEDIRRTPDQRIDKAAAVNCGGV